MEKSLSGCGRLTAIISLIASLIGIFIFLTGWENIWEVLQALSGIGDVPGPNQGPTLTQVTTQGTREQTPLILVNTPTALSSSDGRWTQVGLPGETVSYIATGKGHIVYAGTSKNEHGVFKSSDDGENWSAKNNGLKGLDITSLIVAPGNPDVVVVTTRGFTWMSKDGAESWLPLMPTGVNDDHPVAFGSKDGKRLFAAKQWTEMHESTNGGKSWQEIAREAPCDQMYPVPSTNVIYCLLFGSAGSPDYDVYRSDDNGRTWWKTASVGASYDAVALAIDETNASVVYVGTKENGVYKSTDSGGSWAPINNTLPNQGSDLYINSIVIDSLNPDVVYIAIDGRGVYKSTNGGESWQVIKHPSGKNVLALALGQDSPRYVFAGTDQGVLRYELP